ncbi:hypothetical protein NP233_g3567 [Leucocoprinus birnbaumii]|uniref:V-type proton ATPase subunit E n=1 Tax=Leucocoprinus birnbaumii TaxID=56174 RepID=A0AAD5YWB4_9AGAR|nr:hypothetical protein NP233_g3567 [Leucocoprinus birnbaumii]
MSTRALNDEEVLTEMNKMVAFIKQEALEKAREIKVKADEEFAIEKAKLVKQEQQAIDAQYEKKRKGAEVAQKNLLHRREEHLQDLFAISRTELAQLAGKGSESGSYTQFLEGVIVQGFLQIMEPKVFVHTRTQDADVAKQAAEAASKTYKELTGKSVEFEIVSDLGKDGAGGVTLVNASQRITVDNTLDERLRLLEDRMLPEIRRDLFGVNENRKFYT